MNNKRGGFGAKLLLVLILMLASAVGGAYGYRVLDGKMAVRDAKKEVADVKVSDYDTEEAVSVQEYIDNANKDLETATTRKEVYEIIDSFKSDVDKVMTKTEKELEEARRAANNANNNNNYNNQNGQTYDQNNGQSTDNSSGSDDNSSNGLFGIFGNNNNDSSAEEDQQSTDSDIFN